MYMPPAFQHVTSKPGNGPEDEVKTLTMLKSIVTMVSDSATTVQVLLFLSVLSIQCMLQCIHV